MTRRERRAFNEYLIAEARKTRGKRPAARDHTQKSAQLADKISDFAASIGQTLTELEAEKLANGDDLTLNGKRWRGHHDGSIRPIITIYEINRSSLMSRVYTLHSRSRHA